MKLTKLIGLPVALLLVFYLSSSCTTPPPAVTPPPESPPPPPAVKQEVIVEEVVDMLQKWMDENLKFVLDKDGNMHLLLSIVFRADADDFDGLPQDVVTDNQVSLAHVAEIMRMMTAYNVRIEGHANPTTPPGSQLRALEEPILNMLSEQRAMKVLDELSKLGVDVSRKTVVGMGASRATYAYDDTANNWKNRRVEFILYKR